MPIMVTITKFTVFFLNDPPNTEKNHKGAKVPIDGNSFLKGLTLMRCVYGF